MMKIEGYLEELGGKVFFFNENRGKNFSKKKKNGPILDKTRKL